MVKSEAMQKCLAEIVIDEDVNYHRKDYYWKKLLSKVFLINTIEFDIPRVLSQK